MLEAELSDEGDLGFESRDSIAFGIHDDSTAPTIHQASYQSKSDRQQQQQQQQQQLYQQQRFPERASVIRLIRFGWSTPTNLCHRVFDRISITTLGHYKNVNDVPFDDHTEAPRQLQPFHESNDFTSPVWRHFDTTGTPPAKRESFARFNISI